jgi:hypothetical protein
LNQYSSVRRACLALAFAVLPATAMAGPEVCGGSSTACLEQMSAMLSARDGAVEPAPRARRVVRREPAAAPAHAAMPHLNLEQKLNAHPDSEEPEGT